MKNRSAAKTLKRAALGAALFIFSGPLAGLELDEKPGLKAADERVQRLYAQVVKLHRRFAGQKKYPTEPFKSLLTEISLYHGDKKAEFSHEVEGYDAEVSPGELVPIGPWATKRLAQLLVDKGDHAEAILQYRELAKNFSGLMVVEPEVFVEKSGSRMIDPEWRFAEESGISGALGEIDVLIDLLREKPSKDTLEEVHDKLFEFEKKFGRVSVPCDECVHHYNLVALKRLWKTLVLSGASYDEWTKKTVKFLKFEESSELRAWIHLSLGDGSRKLGKFEKAKDFYGRVIQESPGQVKWIFHEGGEFRAYGPSAAKARLDMALQEKKDIKEHQAILEKTILKTSETLKNGFVGQMHYDVESLIKRLREGTNEGVWGEHLYYLDESEVLFGNLLGS